MTMPLVNVENDAELLRMHQDDNPGIRIHRIVRGDRLPSLAETYGVTVESILAANPEKKRIRLACTLHEDCVKHRELAVACMAQRYPTTAAFFQDLRIGEVILIPAPAPPPT